MVLEAKLVSSSFSFPSRAISRISRLFASKGKSISVLVRLLFGCTLSLKISSRWEKESDTLSYLCYTPNQENFKTDYKATQKGVEFICSNLVVYNTDVCI